MVMLIRHQCFADHHLLLLLLLLQLSLLLLVDTAVYESLLEEARRSSLNMKPDGTRIPVPKFVEAMRPYVDQAVLEYQNQAVPPSSGGGDEEEGVSMAPTAGGAKL
jgi:hypothetical protein